MMDIRGLAYVVAQTTDVPRWKNFAENVLGMMTAATPDGWPACTHGRTPRAIASKF